MSSLSGTTASAAPLPVTSSSAAASSAVTQNVPDEEELKTQLRQALQSLTRREPLDPTYKPLLTDGLVTPRKPTLPRDRLYRQVGARLRERVEAFVSATQGGDPWSDRISSREKIEDENLRSALTLRERKRHEQEALLAATLAALPRRNGMDEATRRRRLEEMALGMQTRKKKKAKRAVPTSSTTSAHTTTATSTSDPNSLLQQEELMKQKEEREREQAIQRAREREAARKRREEEERQREEAEREEELRQSRMVETPRQALHRVYDPIFRVLWDMEFANLGGTNPFRIVIDMDNCTAMGAPDYFDIVKTPMNLTYIQRKVTAMEYETLQAFFADVELMLSNALLYNSDPNNDFHLAAKEMKRVYKKIAKRVVQSLQQQQQSR